MQASYRTATSKIPRRMPLPDTTLTQGFVRDLTRCPTAPTPRSEGGLRGYLLNKPMICALAKI
jgi:hypothetical protein